MKLPISSCFFDNVVGISTVNSGADIICDVRGVMVWGCDECEGVLCMYLHEHRSHNCIYPVSLKCSSRVPPPLPGGSTRGMMCECKATLTIVEQTHLIHPLDGTDQLVPTHISYLSLSLSHTHTYNYISHLYTQHTIGNIKVTMWHQSC